MSCSIDKGDFFFKYKGTINVNNYIIHWNYSYLREQESDNHLNVNITHKNPAETYNALFINKIPNEMQHFTDNLFDRHFECLPPP